MDGTNADEYKNSRLIKEEYKKCGLCAHNCGANRLINLKGLCKAGKSIIVAKSMLHKWEEPCISGENGSGTIFFSNCSLKCVYCQNAKISRGAYGEEKSIKELAEICLNLQKDKAHNINLVTPTHYIPEIIEAINFARCMGLNIPIIYNTASFERVNAIELLKGTIDSYLPDMKYFDDALAIKYSNAKNYFAVASRAIEAMVSQTGKIAFQPDGMIKSGVIVRHLCLPGQKEDSKKIIKYLFESFKNNIYLSIMNQFTPISDNLKNYPELNRKLSLEEYDDIINYAMDLGVEQGFIQEGEAASESFIPDF